MGGKQRRVVFGLVLSAGILGGAFCAAKPDLGSVPAPAFSGNVEGEWEIVHENAMAGPLKGSLVFVQQGDRLSVKIGRPDGRDFACEGKIEGMRIEWILERPARGGGTSKLIYSGHIKDDNRMEGTYRVEGGESVPWRAKRIVK